MTIALTNVNLIVADMPRALAFYQELLGLSPDERQSAPPTFVVLRAGTSTLSIQDAAAAGETPGAGPGIELGFEVEDLDGLAQHLAAGGYLDAPIQTMGWGRALSISDPEGHRLNLFTRR